MIDWKKCNILPENVSSKLKLWTLVKKLIDRKCLVQISESMWCFKYFVFFTSIIDMIAEKCIAFNFNTFINYHYAKLDMPSYNLQQNNFSD